jgi:N-acetylglutamate synthase-like GNAT family acetyltransferase
MVSLRRLTADDLPGLRRFWIEHWHGEEIIAHGQVIRPEQVEGFVFGGWSGLITFCFRGTECEITSINSLQDGQGTGSAMIEAVINEAKIKGCQRVFVITTNDNLRALGFYQKCGFSLVAIYRNAIDESRKRKPTIPRIGENGIPLRDEIELELLL